MSARRTATHPGIAASLIAGSLLLAACSTTTATSVAGEKDETAGVTDSEIRLGMSNALSGPVAAVCLPASEGAKAWLAKVNDEGGVNGRKVTLAVLDDGSEAPRAAANVRDLTHDGVFAMFGGCGTISAAAIATALKGSDVPYLFPYAALPDLVEPVQPNVFALLPLYRDQMFTAIDHVVAKAPGKVYTVTSQIPGYESTVAGAEAGVKSAGGTLLSSALLPATNAPAEQEAAKAGQKDADYLAMTVLAPDAARMLNAMAQADNLPAKAALGASPLAAQSFAAALSPKAGKLLETLSPTVPPGDPAAKECVDALAEHSPDTNPDALALFGCAAAQVLVAGLQAAGDDLTRSGLTAALEDMSGKQISSLLPPVSFSADDHVGLDSMFLLTLDPGQQYRVEETVPLKTAP
jgi:branched-chain amino acid transport system substrate-binding protein